MTKLWHVENLWDEPENWTVSSVEHDGGCRAGLYDTEDEARERLIGHLWHRHGNFAFMESEGRRGQEQIREVVERQYKLRESGGAA